jgi:hypothetical protein
MKVRKKSEVFYSLNSNESYMPEISRDELMEEVRKLMDMDEDELYAILGAQAFALERPTELQFMDFSSITKRIELGKALYGEYKQRMGEIICDEWGYCEKKKKYSGDITLMIELIPVVGAGFGFTGISIGVAAVLSVLVFKHRLDKFCGCKA